MKDTIQKYIPDYYYSKVENVVGHESTRHVHKEFEIYYMKGLLAKRNVEQLSDITDPNELAALVEEAGGIGNG